MGLALVKHLGGDASIITEAVQYCTSYRQVMRSNLGLRIDS